MLTTIWLLTCVLLAIPAEAYVQAVFAHFMVSNTGSYSLANWQDDIQKAQAAKIDAFALNIAKGEATNVDSLPTAFQAASGLGFKLFFSFDYAGNGLWAEADVINLINQYSSNSAYFRRGSQPLVSTFEGPAAAADWTSIKASTGCFFIPSWSSLGAAPAWAKGTADGLFSWAAWPDGKSNMSTFTDASYTDTLAGSPYIMPVSPWFYTNMPGFRKNWLWHSDDLWLDRWINVLSTMLEYVEIITWNDYGESHFIGPLRDNAYTAFTTGKAPFNYAKSQPHDGWRVFLPYLISLAKTGEASFSEENISAWYRQNPKAACGDDGTTGNTATQLQTTYDATDLIEDSIFFAAILSATAVFSVTINGQSTPITWKSKPKNGVGLYRGSAPYLGMTGPVVITVTRGSQILQASGPSITYECTDGLANFNPVVISGSGHAVAAVSPVSLSQSGCTSGWGDASHQDLCAVTCKYNYCPKGACTCSSLDTPNDTPVWDSSFTGCPAPGVDATFIGLCTVACAYGHCPDTCKKYSTGYTCTAPLPTAPPVPVCQSGMADGTYEQLCGFSCQYGFCPPELCSCTKAGTYQISAPLIKDMTGSALGNVEDYGLCEWTCLHGKCPSDLCDCVGEDCPLASGDDGDLVGIDDEFTSITGKQTASTLSNLVDWELGDKCEVFSGCVLLENPQASSCGSLTKVGWDYQGCDSGYGRPICCPAATLFDSKKCLWRGGTDGSRNCNGQCHEGEATIWSSSWGGGFNFETGASLKKCKNGKKAFCCPAPEYSVLTYGCRQTTTCVDLCTNDETEVLTSINVESKTDCVFTRTCCPKDTPLHSCKWRGTASNCGDAKCEYDEIAIARSSLGDTLGSCISSRQKIACCQVSNSIPLGDSSPTCTDTDLCDLYGLCGYEGEDSVDDISVKARRHLAGHRHSHGHSHGTSFDSPQLSEADAHYNELEDRASYSTETRKYATTIDDGTTTWTSEIKCRPYWPSGTYYTWQVANSQNAIYYRSPSLCNDMDVEETVASTNRPTDLQTDHLIDLQNVRDFLDAAVRGVLPNDRQSDYPALDPAFIDDVLNNPNGLPTGLAQVSPNSPDFTLPLDRIFECMGSTTNPESLVLLQDKLNVLKGTLLRGSNPFQVSSYTTALKKYLDGKGPASAFLELLHKTFNLFGFLNGDEDDDSNKFDVPGQWKEIMQCLETQWGVIEGALSQADNRAIGLQGRWVEYFQAVLDNTQVNTQSNVLTMVTYSYEEIIARVTDDNTFDLYQDTLNALLAFDENSFMIQWPV